MDYVALVAGDDLTAFGEGAYYVNLHVPCAIAGVTYQQT